MVGHRPLKPRIGVRVPVPQVLMNEMNRRLGGVTFTVIPQI
jgi:hypothetical protein